MLDVRRKLQCSFTKMDSARFRDGLLFKLFTSSHSTISTVLIIVPVFTRYPLPVTNSCYTPSYENTFAQYHRLAHRQH